MEYLEFNTNRAIEFIRMILSAYRNSTHLYAHVHHTKGEAPQQKFIPKSVEVGSVPHALYLLGTTATDYLSGSYDVFATMEYIWVNHPELFTEDILKMSAYDVSVALSQARAPFAVQSGARLYGSLQTVFRYFDGDPRKVFSLGDSIDEVYEYKKKFKRNHDPNFLLGYGPKLLSLLAIHYEGFGIIDKYFPGSFPVDRHIQRQLIATDVVKCSLLEVDAAYVIAEFIRPRLIALCHEMDVSLWELSHAMWFLGNRICHQCHRLQKQNRVELLAYCPMTKICKGGIQTNSYQKRGKWNFTKVGESSHEGSTQMSLFDL